MSKHRRFECARCVARAAIAVAAAMCVVNGCATGKDRFTAERIPISKPAPTSLEQAPSLRDRSDELMVKPKGGEPIALTRDGALLTAITNNRSIEVARYGPQVGQTLVPEARAAFDPKLMGTLSTGRDTRQRAATYSTKSSATSLLSSNGTQSSGSSGSGSSSATPLIDAILQGVELNRQALSDLQGIAALLEQPEHPFIKTDNTNGSLILQNYLPTGTLVFLTGEVTHTDTNLAPDDYLGEWTLGVTQSLLRGRGLDVNLVELKQAKNLAAQSEQEFRRRVLQLAGLVEDAYWEFVLAQEVLKIREFAVTLADEQLRRNQDLFSVGKIVEGDVMSAKAEKASRTADLTDARAAIRAQTLALIRLLNPESDRVWDITFSPVDQPDVAQIAVNPDLSEQLAMQYRPELYESQLELANRDLDVVRTRNNLMPRLDLTATYGRTSRGTSSSDSSAFLDSPDFDNFRVGLDFETPILYRGEKARHSRAKLLQAQAGASVSDVEQGVSTEVRQAVVEVERQWERIGATQEAVKSRLEELRIAQDRNAVGKATNLDVQIVQRNLIQAEVDEVTARVRYIEALTALYAAEGTLLERRGIRMDSEFENGEEQ
ncbi:MAG: TolC family protein [Candidatus Hydrogenedentes bacterium]|nr:TolC family protein [Candidatus Hydrogenedentota bacterium]